MPTFVAVWFAGVAVLALRLLGGWLWAQRTKRHGAADVPASLQLIVARLARRLHVPRHVRLLQSPAIDVPTVIGWLRPVILLPLGSLAGLTPSQVEAILAHELAHIRRHDYLVNLLQTLIETVLFYHPAVWWLSRRIREERENCCDDLAVALCGDPVAYAKALAELEGQRGSGVLALAVTGGPLLQRVRRLLTGAPAAHAGRGPIWLAGGGAMVLLGAIVVVSASSPEAPQEVPPQNVNAQEAMVQNPPPPPPPPTPAVPAPPPPDPRRSSERSVPPPPPPPPPPPLSQRSQGHVSWSNGGEKIEVKYRGEFEFSDDDSDIKRMVPGGYLRVSEGGWLSSRSVEFTADESGKITRRFYVGSAERPFEPEGRQWLAEKLPRLIRQSGMGAKARVARIFAAQGASGVLTEISRIDGSYAKKLYFTELLQMNLDPQTVRGALAQAEREVTSDYELASLLIASAERLLDDESTRRAFFAATRSIESDYEMRRVFSAALKRGTSGEAALGALLDAAAEIQSDYELAELLVQLARTQSIEGAAPRFFARVESVESSYERGRILKGILTQSAVSTELLQGVLKSAATMDAGYELSQVLQTAARRHKITGATRDLYLAAADRLRGYEQSQALAALARSDR